MIMLKEKELVDLEVQAIKVPKVFSKNNHEYLLINQCNENLWLYQDLLYGYKVSFTAFELGLVKQKIKPD